MPSCSVSQGLGHIVWVTAALSCTSHSHSAVHDEISLCYPIAGIFGAQTCCGHEDEFWFSPVLSVSSSHREFQMPSPLEL